MSREYNVYAGPIGNPKELAIHYFASDCLDDLGADKFEHALRHAAGQMRDLAEQMCDLDDRECTYYFHDVGEDTWLLYTSALGWIPCDAPRWIMTPEEQ